MSINSRFKCGPVTSKPASGVQGLSSIKPEMMYRVLSSIQRAKADEAPKHVKLMELFPRGTEKCTIERDSAFSSTIDRSSSSMGGPFPKVQDSRSHSGGSQDKQCTAQMTIFYNGEVNVYIVSAEKAEAIIKLATSCSTTMAPSVSSEQIPKHYDSKDEQVKKLCRGLPIARKLSLQRFLEKRKNRLRSTAPYSSTWTSSSEFGNSQKKNTEQQTNLSLGVPIP